MINFKIKYCSVKGCFNKRIYTFPLKKIPLYCCIHKDTNMIDVVNKICIKCKYYNISNVSKKLCSYCYNISCPESSNTYNFLYKQRKILDDIRFYLESNYKDKLIYNLFIDKKILGGKSNYRPDFLLKLSDKNVLIEVDENQHKSYKNVDEDMRMVDILNDLNNQFTYIIRINCDEDLFNQSMFIKNNNKIEINKDIYNKKIKKIYEMIDFAIENNEYEKKYILKYLFYKN